MSRQQPGLLKYLEMAHRAALVVQASGVGEFLLREVLAGGSIDKPSQKGALAAPAHEPISKRIWRSRHLAFRPVGFYPTSA